MIRLLFLVALMFVAAIGFAWLAARPGDLTLVWQGYEVRTSLMVAALAVVVLIALIAIAGAIIRAVVRTPHSVGSFLGARRRDRGYRALTRGMIAVGAGDVRAARRAAQESQGLLGKEPLVMLLSAQAAQIAGDAPAARTAFEALAADTETRLLGLHGLFIEARRQGEDAAARHFAEEAHTLAPKTAWAGHALFEHQARHGDWRGALDTLTANAEAKLVDHQQARRQRAVLDTARAMELEAGEPEEARALALEAHKLAPDLVAAATIAARLFARAGEYRRASRVLEATWKIAPHPEIAEAYAAVRPGDSAHDRLMRTEKLAALHANSAEGALATARAAIDAREWQEARDALAGIVRAAPTERACLLMAEIEAGEHGDQARARSWLTRALTAPRDPVWVADGQVFEHWAPLSPVTGKLDAFQWRVVEDKRPVRIAFDPDTEGTVLEVNPAAVVAPAVSQPPPSPTLSVPLPAAPPPATMAIAAVPRDVSMQGDPRPAEVRLPLAVEGGSGSAKGARPMARAPDDPGPDADEEDGRDLPLFYPNRPA
jgi:HemY protein